MKKTTDFLNDLRAKHGLTSDYQLAKLMGCQPSALSNYRNGRSHFDDQTAILVADLLNEKPDFVVACIHAERAKHANEKKLWERLAKLASGVTVAVVGAVIMSAYYGHGIDAQSVGYALVGFTNSIHYASFNLTELVVFFLFIGACILAFPRHNPPKN